MIFKETHNTITIEFEKDDDDIDTGLVRAGIDFIKRLLIKRYRNQ
jgi:hypothetical protein